MFWKILLGLALFVALSFPYVLIGSLVVGTVARFANRRMDWADEDDRPLIFFGVVLWPLVVLAALVAFPIHRFFRWSVGHVKDLTRPPKPKPRDEWSE